MIFKNENKFSKFHFVHFRVARANPGKTVREIMKIQSEAWHQLDETDKAKYAAQKEAEWSAYQAAMEAWEAKMAKTPVPLPISKTDFGARIVIASTMVWLVTNRLVSISSSSIAFTQGATFFRQEDTKNVFPSLG